ncbi:MAG: primosomal protein N', partial [Candidatus Omnitrophica bacterium]|nr:primosomal protein N' [Candidatus Omnitrophota bacterium]
MKYAEIALNIPIDKTFHYSIPPATSPCVEIGKRAWVTFGKRRMVGYIVGLSETSPVSSIKPLEGIIDDVPVLDGEQMKFTKWMSEYYCTSWGSTLDAAIPWPLKKGRTSIRERGGATAEEHFSKSSALPPTDEQQRALKEIKGAVEKSAFEVFLLHGVTSSGKTEVYLQCISDIIEKDKSAIVLIPEISLTPQTVERFKSRFGDAVAIAHSQMKGSSRFKEWKRLRDGLAKVAVGPRSALFSPVRNLGLIVVDEEHDTSYKQGDTPRYHAREASVERARQAGCPVILGSATPSMESYFLAKKGEYRLLELTRRIDDRPLPQSVVIDMKKEMAKGKRSFVISTYLRKRIDETLKADRQTMLFLNRRGFSTYIFCKQCGYTEKCKKCDTVMVYHSSKRQLVCHYCNWKKEKPNICPTCHSTYLSYSGKGTEKIESEIHRNFPYGKIERMDSDVTRRRGAHKAILKNIKEGKTNILIGTQMIAKGHDFPQVTLVGVISADVSLNLPDFRSGERTFNLLTQVAGRAGRGKDAGEIVIQTYAPAHYAIQAAAKQDYIAFYNRELELRRDLNFPPFTHIIEITLKAVKDDIAQGAARELVEY